MAVVGVLMTSCVETARLVPLRPEERVIGRIRQSGRVRLLTSERRLVTMEPQTGEVVVRELRGLTGADQPWGLASAGADRVFSLLGADVLGEFDRNGRLLRRLGLPGKYVSLFGVASGLILQPASTRPGDHVLRWFDPSNSTLSSVGTLRATEFDTRYEHVALNLVSCGSTQGGELPCWFNQDTRIDRIQSTGRGSLVDLVGAGLMPHPTRTLERVETAGPVLDAHIDTYGRLWVLIRRPDKSVGTRRAAAAGVRHPARELPGNPADD